MGYTRGRTSENALPGSPLQRGIENFSEFSSVIYGCLNDAHLKHKKELDFLLTLRFQKFNKSQIMNV
jgi:hypothetical protein